MTDREKYLIESIRGLGIGLTVAGVVASLIQEEPTGYFITIFGLGLITYGFALVEEE